MSLQTFMENAHIRNWFQIRGRSFMKEIGIKPGHRIVDFGCGIGGCTVPAAQVVGSRGHVYALDQDAAQINTLAQDIEQFGLNNAVTLLNNHGDVDLLPIPDKDRHAVLLFDVLQHVSDWERLFANCRRVLRQDGKLYINPSWVSHPGKVNPDTLYKSLAGQGFYRTSLIQRHIMHYKAIREDQILTFNQVTDFQYRVYRALQRVPRGCVTTYRLLAEAAGTQSARAVGQALANNPLPTYVPCHRVVKTDLSLGGFTRDGTATAVQEKERRLRQEGVSVRNGCIADATCIVDVTTLQQVQ